MFNSLYDLKPGMLIEVQDCHHAEPHIYEVSHIKKDAWRDIIWAVSNPADYHHNFNDITAVWERQGNDYVRVWTYDPIAHIRYNPEGFDEHYEALVKSFKELLLASITKGETNA